MTAPLLLERLRERTRPQHEALDGVVPWGWATTPERCRKLFGRYLGFYEPLERRLAEVTRPEALSADEFSLGGSRSRFKTGILKADLAALGATEAEIAALPRCGRIPPLEDAGAVVGAWYVTEGATLGGQYLARSLRERPGLTPETGAGFASLYGDETGPRWKAFKRCGNAFGEANPAACNAAVETAAAMFAAFGDWFAAWTPAASEAAAPSAPGPDA